MVLFVLLLFISKVLHVKSLSEWAPLCIGPYSQANVLNNSILYIAGFISLITFVVNYHNIYFTTIIVLIRSNWS